MDRCAASCCVGMEFSYRGQKQDVVARRSFSQSGNAGDLPPGHIARVCVLSQSRRILRFPVATGLPPMLLPKCEGDCSKKGQIRSQKIAVFEKNRRRRRRRSKLPQTVRICPQRVNRDLESELLCRFSRRPRVPLLFSGFYCGRHASIFSLRIGSQTEPSSLNDLSLLLFPLSVTNANLRYYPSMPCRRVCSPVLGSEPVGLVTPEFSHAGRMVYSARASRTLSEVAKEF